MEYQTFIESTPEQKMLQGKAIRSLVFGIVSIAIPHVIGLIFGILAITQGNSANNYAQLNGLQKDKRATAGRILGIAGIIVSIIAMIWTAIKLWAFVTALIASIQTGSLGVVGDYFQNLGELFSNGGY